MYEDYFGLERPPFKITPDTSLFYEGGKRGDILAALVYAIHRGEGIIKVVGEVGSGKTMLCRMLQLKLPDTVEIVYIANPSVSAEDILFVIAHELSLSVSKEASKHEVMHGLQDYLLQRHMENKQVVLFVEEAQGMPIDTLEEIRLLSNLETDQNKLLQIVLFGQPELDDNLAQQSIRQLRERITHNFDLEPLSQDEIHNYLNFRMRQVGYTGPELINQNLAKKVEQYSDGLLRRINIIADKILLSAFAEGTHNLTVKHVTAAVNDSAFNNDRPAKSYKVWWIAGLVAIALAFAVFQSSTQWNAAQTTNTSEKAEIAAIIDKPVTDIGASEAETVRQTEIKADEVVAAPVEAIEAEASEDALAQSEPEATGETDAVSEPDGDVTGALQVSENTVITEVTVAEKPVEEEQLDKVQVSTSTEEDLTLRKALDQAQASEQLASEIQADLSLTADHNQWLNAKLRQSREWLSRADRDGVSIQVMMRSKSAARELVYFLRNEWPLDLSKTYLYEVSTENRSIYRVFYSEFESLASGRQQIEKLPESVKVNSPYLNSVYRMQKALL
ncbi:MAG: AAA family ATPase [Pseudomonadota bacterium]